MKKLVKFFTILITITLVLVAVVIAVLAFPVFGNTALIVRSGSMEPNIPVGSVVVVRPSETNIYSVGDVISFKRDANTVVTHRVTEIENTGKGYKYTTKGDANEEADGWTVDNNEILGKSFVTLPEFGKFLAFARSKYGFPLLIIFPSALVILVESINIIREVRKSGRKRKEEKLSATFNPDLSGEKYNVSPDSYFTKKNFYAIKIMIPIFAFGLFFQSTSAFFSDTESSNDNLFQAASSFPTSPTPTPTGGAGGNPCDDINVDISGNGAGSVNGVFIICENNEVVEQTNNTTTNTNINVNSNTGNNSNNGNTNTSTTTTSGSTSTNVSVTVSGGTNTNSSSTPTPTLTPTP